MKTLLGASALALLSGAAPVAPAVLGPLVETLDPGLSRAVMPAALAQESGEEGEDGGTASECDAGDTGEEGEDGAAPCPSDDGSTEEDTSGEEGEGG